MDHAILLLQLRNCNGIPIRVNVKAHKVETIIDNGNVYYPDFILNENCKMAIAISSSRADSASVPGLAFK